MKYSARFTLTSLGEGAAYVGQDARWVMLPLQGGHRFDPHLQTWASGSSPFYLLI